MYKHTRKINRNYDQPFFSRRRNLFRLYFVVVMLLLIVSLPLIAFWQYDRLQLAALNYIGFAPTATPFASDRAALGEDFYRAGNLESAAFYFQQAADQQPDNISYLYELGKILIELDQSAEAVRYGEQIIELASNDPRGYALKANAIAWSNPTDAIPAAQQGLEVDNQYAPLHAALAVAYTRIGRYQEALREGDLAVRLAPSDANARRAFSYPLIFTANYQRAIQELEQAIAINPNITGPYFELASLYRNRAINRPEVAVSIFRRVLEIEPDNERAYLRLCETYAAAGLFQEAEPFCDAALEIDPDYASAHRMSGQLRYSRRNYEGAIESFQRCFELSTDPANPDYNAVEIECLYIRGLAHYFLGNENCDFAWQWLNISLNHPSAQGSVLESILTGLFNTTQNCAGYAGRQLPTPIPPTPIPPTPIGGI